MDIDLSSVESHSGKPLYKHIQGVLEGVQKRTNSRIAAFATYFHDLGKINPCFQKKLQGNNPDGYSNHAYLSAYAWLCFCKGNNHLLADIIGNHRELVHGIAAIIAHHHGNLPNLEHGVFRQGDRSPRKELSDFLLSGQGILPCSDYLHILEIPHNSFSLQQEAVYHNMFIQAYLSHERISDPLNFFFEVQFSFACLIEADKRDAGNNKDYLRDTLGQYFIQHFTERFQQKIDSFTTSTPLNQLRTAMRNEAVESIKHHLHNGHRVFSLCAPTGAGKTMMLLALANEIIKLHSQHHAIYTLPFLSITEQVERECRSVFYDNENAVQRIDSRSENKRITSLQEQLDSEPEKLQDLLKEYFSEQTFDHPFVITTFVQFFETLVSNRNATLLKLPNFSQRVILIDEVQALPAQLYLFFTAFLDEFCRRFDSYVVLSTATMPHFTFPHRDYHELDRDLNPRELFSNYKEPVELLDSAAYFHSEVFNRYTIHPAQQTIRSIAELADHIQEHHATDSCLVILNTIDDTKDLYAYLESTLPPDLFHEQYRLLNTYFIPDDRQEIIRYCTERLQEKRPVFLIATQLIEAGVDIDFPIVYRDLCPLPSIIQSAGRCNRNGKLEKGTVYLTQIMRSEHQSAASLIYRTWEEQQFLQFVATRLTEHIDEKNLFYIQKDFFAFIAQNLPVGRFTHKNSKEKDEETVDMVKCINHAQFETLGKFRLIDDTMYGNEYRYYVPAGSADSRFEELVDLVSSFEQQGTNFAQIRRYKIQVESKLREMAGRIVTVRITDNRRRQAPHYVEPETLGIRKLARPEDYSSRTGIQLDPSIHSIL